MACPRGRSPVRCRPGRRPSGWFSPFHAGYRFLRFYLKLQARNAVAILGQPSDQTEKVRGRHCFVSKSDGTPCRLLVFRVALGSSKTNFYNGGLTTVTVSTLTRDSRAARQQREDLLIQLLIAEQEAVPDWRESAICSQTDPEAFYPETGQNAEPAKKICSMCSVRAECLEYALDHAEDIGIWGGKSSRERRALRRKRGEVVPDEGDTSPFEQD